MLYEVHITHTGSTFIYVLTVESNSKKKKKSYMISLSQNLFSKVMTRTMNFSSLHHSSHQTQYPTASVFSNCFGFFFATLFVLHITEAFSAVSTSSQRAFLTIIHLLKNSEKHYILWKSFVMNNKLIIYSNIFNTSKI